ncbi:MAG: hypothetical protein ACI4JG_08500 [Acutalibacteraceae bacterium]
MLYRKIISSLLVLIMTICICPVAFATDVNSEGYVPIYTAADFDNIRNNLSGKYILMNHISLSNNEKWETIGKQDSPFKGELDGNGYSIIGLRSSESLLGRIESATIKNLGIVNCSIIQLEETASSSSAAGSFAGHAVNSTFLNCFASGNIQPCVNVGMLGAMSYCSAGGLVGVSKDTSFTNCYSSIVINFIFDKVNSAEIGGMVGEAYNTSFNCCYSTSDILLNNRDKFIDGNSNIHVGGIVGNKDSLTVFNYCYYVDRKILSNSKESTLDNGIECLSASEMKTQDSYIGFDFDNDWRFTTNTYPRLTIEKPTVSKSISINYKEKYNISLYVDQISDWISSDTSVAVLADNGFIYGSGVGEATVTILTTENQVVILNVDVSYSFWQKVIVYFLFGWLWY